MALGLPIIEVLRSVYGVAYENASLKFTPNDLGMIRVTSEMSNTLLTFRRRNNPGGFLEFRGEGENITKRKGGLSYTDESVKTYGFADSREIPVGQLGLKNPESLDPSDRDTVARIATEQMDELMAEAANSLRLWGSLAFLPSITYSTGDTTMTFTNSKVDSSIDVSGTAPWSTTSTDIFSQIIGWKRDFFGTEKPADGLTIMIPIRQTYNLMKNTSIINMVTFGQNNATSTAPAQVNFAQIQQYFLSLHNITIVEWNDAYYASNNESDPYNTTAFLDADHVVVVPRTFYTRTPGSPLYNAQAVGGQGGTAPAIELITAPSADFQYKTNRQGFPGNIMGTIPGAYVFQGFTIHPDPTRPDCYQTAVALDLGLFVERHIRIKHNKVTA